MQEFFPGICEVPPRIPCKNGVNRKWSTPHPIGPPKLWYAGTSDAKDVDLSAVSRGAQDCLAFFAKFRRCDDYPSCLCVYPHEVGVAFGLTGCLPGDTDADEFPNAVRRTSRVGSLVVLRAASCLPRREENHEAWRMAGEVAQILVAGDSGGRGVKHSLCL